MIGLNLVLMVLLGQASPASSSPPDALVSKLGASRYAEREAAASALEKLGRQALPALWAAHHHKDPEIRTRAAALAERIEGGLLTEPTLVTLNIQDRPIAEVAKDIGTQVGVRLALIPENLPAWRTSRVTLVEPKPLPFWKAIDRLCDAAHLQYNPAMNAFPNGREPVLPLFLGGNRPSGPTMDEGPFRITVLSLHHQREVVFQPGARFLGQPAGLVPPPAPVPGPAPANPFRGNPVIAGRPSVDDKFTIQLQVLGEPRLSLSKRGELKLVEAVDDLGQSLLPPDATPTPFDRATSYHGVPVGPVLHLQAPLVHPARVGGTIKHLKGTVLVGVTARKPNPLVVSLASAAGKTFHNDDVFLTVQEVKTNPVNRQLSIDLSVRSNETEPHPAPAAPGIEFLGPRSDLNGQQIEVVDSHGRVLNWYHTGYDAEGSRITLTLNPLDATMAPAQLRYYGLARATREVAFEFKDITMP